MAIGGNFSKPGMGGGAQAPLPSGGLQGGSAQLQQNIQQRIPNQGQFNGNPRGVYNTNFRGQGFAPSYLQQTNLGRYVPPTMSEGGRFGYNSNQWNNFGGYDYNLPGSYGSPQGGGQFAPMPGQFAQYMNPNMLSGNTFGYGSPFGMVGGLNPNPPQGWTPSRNWGGVNPYQQQEDELRVQMYGDMGRAYGLGESTYRDDARQQAVRQFGGGFNLRQMQGASDPRNDPMYNLFNNPGNSPAPPSNSQNITSARGGAAGAPMPSMPAYDRPDNRAYNMDALYQMMGGY